MKRVLSACMLAAMGCGIVVTSLPARAVEFAFSGFGTLGYAISDQPYNYQRFISDDGTFKRDSILGAQMDVRLSPEWSATLQATVAPAMDNDDNWALTTSWAFLSWRPGNDWLWRLGKQRVPIFLNSENRDVGQTYDFARLPAEIYAISPTIEFTGLTMSHGWQPDLGELTLDLFLGQGDFYFRAHSRDQGVLFMPVNTDVSGLVLTLRTAASTWRLGLHHTETELKDGPGFPASYPLVNAGPGISYYQVSDQMPGPGVTYARHIANDVITLGVDVEVAPQWRVVSELARNIQHNTENGANTAAGYVALLHKMGRFTPYVSYAKLRSMGAPVQSVKNLDASQVPGFVPNAQDINASQRVAADIVALYDQDSVCIGTSFAVTPQSKLKAEWMRTRIGNRSAMVDSPTGGDAVRRQGIQVLTLNYSFVF